LRPFGTIQRMPNTTNYKFGDVLLVPFPFTDQTAAKKRPAVVVSSNQYNNGRPDLIVMAITSQLSGYYRIGEVFVTDWKAAALLKLPRSNQFSPPLRNL
jgi:mRNA interferase MazF